MNIETAQHPSGSLAIETHQLRFRWPKQQTPLTFPDIQLHRGEHLFLRGPSGTGKSTLLSLLAGMMLPEAGAVNLLETNLSELKGGARDQFRADHMGVIFQQFNLVPYLSALANVTLSCRLSKRRRQQAQDNPDAAATALLQHLSIPEPLWHRQVTEMSIGQQQRVAAARALIGSPEIILADEPTSALDTDNRDRFIELLLTLAHEHQCSVVFVSHDRSLANHFHHQLSLGGES
ncbi:putative ABC transporter ATP-binding protein [Marinobacter sp. JH2]|nr:ABC transporter ATP-binding protein [Marinobacter sp. JH2]QBM19076.1 putative ABC transporter ATP-binding protein [Marinobacter sp. JH2]